MSQSKKEQKDKQPTYKSDQRSVCLQTVINDRTYVAPMILACHKLEHKEYHPIFFKPKTLSSLALLIMILNLLARSDFLASFAESMQSHADHVLFNI